jgi:hypothetical protein
VGQLKLEPGPAFAHGHVDAIERRSLEAHQHFAGAGLGHGPILDVLQDFRPAVLMEQDSFHEIVL